VSPNGEPKLFVPAVSNLAGKRIAFLNNGWLSFTRIGARMEQALKQRFGIAEMKTWPIPTSCAAEADAAIVGMANLGSCTSWSVHDTAQLVKLGMPAVVIATGQFDKLARVIMCSQRVPESIAITIGPNPEFVSAEELEAIAADLIEQTIARLTQVHAG
jgi:hypothetical protein